MDLRDARAFHSGEGHNPEQLRLAEATIERVQRQYLAQVSMSVDNVIYYELASFDQALMYDLGGERLSHWQTERRRARAALRAARENGDKLADDGVGDQGLDNGSDSSLDSSLRRVIRFNDSDTDVQSIGTFTSEC